MVQIFKQKCKPDELQDIVRGIFKTCIQWKSSNPAQYDAILKINNVRCIMSDEVKKYMKTIYDEHNTKDGNAMDAIRNNESANEKYANDCDTVDRKNKEAQYGDHGVSYNYVELQYPDRPKLESVEWYKFLTPEEYAENFMKKYKNGDASGGAKPNAKKQTKWMSTGKKTVVAIKQGKKKVNVERVIYSNAKGDLRIRKITIMDDKTRQVKYIKF